MSIHHQAMQTLKAFKAGHITFERAAGFLVRQCGYSERKAANALSNA